jgi:hypothetical protein
MSAFDALAVIRVVLRRTSMRLLGGTLFAVLVICHAGSCRANTFCIESGDTQALAAALSDAAANDEDDTLLLQSGVYDLAQNLEHYSQKPYSLDIRGGYSEFFGNPCAVAPSAPDARSSVLRAHSFRIALNPVGGSLTVEGVTFQGALADSQSTDAAIELQSDAVTTIRNSVFSGNTSSNTEAIIIAGAGTIVQNNIFESNESLSGDQIIRVYSVANNPLCHLNIGNTLVKNSSSGGPALEIISNDGCISLLANSILWGNATVEDVHLYSQTVLVDDNFVQGRLGGLDHVLSAEGMTAYDPAFVDWSAGDYALKDESPLINRGEAGSVIWTCGEYDVFGNTRIFGNAPDIGARETLDVIFANGADVIF